MLLVRLCLRAVLHVLTAVLRLSRWTLFIRGLFLFQVFSQAWVSVWLLVPWYLQDVPGVVCCAGQVLMLYLSGTVLCNWTCIILYSSEYRGPASTSSNGHSLSQHSLKHQQPHLPQYSFRQNGVKSASAADHVTVDVTEKGGLPWQYCDRCEMDVPPRAVHCRFCDCCVLRRDHHCHLVDVCIGHWNQRFFVGATANTCVLAFLGIILTCSYLWWHHDTLTRGDNMWNYFLPVTVVKWVCGRVSGVHALLTFHGYMLTVFGPLAAHYCATQICIIGSGRTKREIKRKLKVEVTSGVCANLRLVFGRCWPLSLVLPLPHLLFPQKHQGLSFHNVRMLPVN